ncbi:MAG: hypothetical protein LRY66_11895 [Saccharospirillaceae bacterium]|nr:hypothetical protein [Saccharospirillaceae bacterium]MCD8532021.1 hypothetical protein [Saccharospirillaceae bacterium]
MLVPGNFLHPLTRTMGWLLCITAFCLISAPSWAQQDQLYLRKGPGHAYPVIFEVSSTEQLQPLRQQGEWLLLTNGRRQGWLPVSDVPESSGLSRAQIWSLNDALRPGDWHLQGGWNSETALQLGISHPLSQYRLAARYTRSDAGEQAWSSAELGLEHLLSRYSVWSLLGFAGLGVGLNEEGSRRWDKLGQETSTALFTLSADVIWPLETRLDVRLRFQASQALAADQSLHTAVALIWNMSL